MPPRLRERYKAEIVPQLTKRFSYKNPMQVPRVLKVVVNMGVGEAIQNPKAVDSAVADLQQIAGQKPSVRRARKSVSNFKLRAGVPIGCAVTLRGVRMWEFLDRLLTFAVPRIRDFRGIPRRGFDGRGNFTFGVKEQLIFPEIDYDTVDQIRGMDISIVTTARTDEEAFELLSGLGMPFARQA
ncbi:MAG TPA: 50S ribosomal protein L5 [Candidatus Latescibacteria bacterium]|nr:50S ribosomal protein L5 [Candidatus Latescibacterota bacterium]HOF60910.1 50S ribosomal protein L5 [Candidatus Latescibacterota bacterium]HOM56577.1 50S ribosomal protein L5 [Candidatus Latescibacterota bacterium]HOS64700.1 50S ribosomal protein L5 [Candidatus Latescibacterota bacterium]HOT36754.1 50S ribosomal protein L5 [Candidatus Latescibacterota bacterium]